MAAGSSWRRLPAAELRGLAKVGRPASAREALSSANAARGRYTSPRTSTTAGGDPPSGVRSTCGMARMVRRLAVTSSPITPSPRVDPCTKRPFSYVSEIARPSIFGSTPKRTSREPSPSCSITARARRYQSASSSGPRALARLSMGRRCRTGANRSEGAAPTR